MVVSASRRCDIPAHYPDWLLGRVAAGYCLVASPYDARRLTRVSLAPEDVDFLVLWTRDPRPLLPHMRALDDLGIRSYVQMTVTGYPEPLEPGGPAPDEAVDALRELADAVGPRRVIWRYDPVFVARSLGPDFHRDNFSRLARALEGWVERVTLSLLDEYAFTAGRLARAGFPGAVFGSPRRGPDPKADGGHVSDIAQREPLEDESPSAGLQAATAGSADRALPPEPYPALLAGLAAIARARGMTPQSCAEPFDLSSLGIEAGACVDPGLAASLWGVEAAAKKDSGQRPACRCAPSSDIGAYGACPRGCVYCYANRGSGRLRAAGPADEAL